MLYTENKFTEKIFSNYGGTARRRRAVQHTGYKEQCMFIGRDKELEILHQQFNAAKRTAVLVYGKRRVGKSTLIKEAARDFAGVVINHLCIRSSYEGNLNLLCRSVCLALGLPPMNFASIFDLFDFLKSYSKPILIVLDEYQYLKDSLKENEVDSYMQVIVDSLPENVKVVLCGSYISIMKELLLESNPLFGRFTAIVHLEEFDYYDAAKFYPDLSVRDKIRFYAVFGGSPFVLTNLDPAQDIRQNISSLLINQNSILRTHIENVMLSEIQKAYDTRVFEIIGNSKKKYSDIAAHLGNRDNGLLDKQLKNLINMETLIKVFPINRSGDKKKQFYEIKDNLMRFYFAYIFGNDSLISKLGEESFYDAHIASSLNTFVSYRFEGIVIQYFMRQARIGRLHGIEDFGSFWYDDKETKTNGQFDCVLKEADGYDFYEVKFFEHPMTLDMCRKEETQVRALTELYCRKIGFVCSAGFSFDTDEYDLITGEDIYNS